MKASQFAFLMSTPGYVRQSGEASFTPDTVDELITTVRELIELAKRARKRRPVLTEYIVSVGNHLRSQHCTLYITQKVIHRVCFCMSPNPTHYPTVDYKL